MLLPVFWCPWMHWILFLGILFQMKNDRLSAVINLYILVDVTISIQNNGQWSIPLNQLCTDYRFFHPELVWTSAYTHFYLGPIQALLKLSDENTIEILFEIPKWCSKSSIWPMAVSISRTASPYADPHWLWCWNSFEA